MFVKNEVRLSFRLGSITFFLSSGLVGMGIVEEDTGLSWGIGTVVGVCGPEVGSDVFVPSSVPVSVLCMGVVGTGIGIGSERDIGDVGDVGVEVSVSSCCEATLAKLLAVVRLRSFDLTCLSCASIAFSERDVTIFDPWEAVEARCESTECEDIRELSSGSRGAGGLGLSSFVA